MGKDDIIDVDEVIDSEEGDEVDEIDPFEDITGDVLRKCKRDIIDDIN